MNQGANPAPQPQRRRQPVLSVAPMMGYTDRYLRYMLRCLSPNSWLFTEMITTGALIHSEPSRRLMHHPSEHPLALQLGGGDPQSLATAAKIAVDHGYRHLNLNAGCPSRKVQNAGIGACLIKNPARLRECAGALRVPGVDTVSVKTRIGVDGHDSHERCLDLARGLYRDGIDFLVLHARKAWLQGLSPSQNRSLPPLDYGRVWRLQEELPELPIILNGGLRTAEDCRQALKKCAGVMIGRGAIEQPLTLMAIEECLWGTSPVELSQVFESYLEFLADEAARDSLAKARHPLRPGLRHLMLLIKNAPGAAAIRRRLSQAANLDQCAQICRHFADICQGQELRQGL